MRRSFKVEIKTIASNAVGDVAYFRDLPKMFKTPPRYFERLRIMFITLGGTSLLVCAQHLRERDVTFSRRGGESVPAGRPLLGRRGDRAAIHVFVVERGATTSTGSGQEGSTGRGTISTKKFLCRRGIKVRG
jgi:hypothetical protein